MILPALIEAVNPGYRPIKYSLFPPLGLATLAAYLDEDDEVTIEDEHVERINLNDEPDVVVIQVYITSANRAYWLADHYRSRGACVALGGLHVTSLPEEAAGHADTIFIGPGEDSWPAFLADFRAGRPGKVYSSRRRTLAALPPVRRDLIKRRLYLVPNSIVVSRGCPHHCDFCYKDAFFRGGRSFYTQPVDAALKEIERLPGRHLYFLDDHLFGHPAVFSLLRVDTHPRVMLDTVLRRPLRLVLRDLEKVIAKTLHVPAVPARPECGFADGDTAHLGQRLVVVRRSGHHMNVGIDVIHDWTTLSV